MQGLDLSSPPATMWATSTDDTVDMVITIPAITTMGDTEEDTELTNMATATASSMVWRTGMVAATITTLTTGMAATTRGDILDTSVRTDPESFIRYLDIRDQRNISIKISIKI